MGTWPGSYLPDPEVEYPEPNDAQLDTQSSYTAIVFLDAWGHP